MYKIVSMHEFTYYKGGYTLSKGRISCKHNTSCFRLACIYGFLVGIAKVRITFIIAHTYEIPDRTLWLQR